jgi:hypothetical protein
MKKVKIYILWFICAVAMVLEFAFSIIVALTEAIGLKLNELTDALDAIYQKAKN